MSAPWSSNTVRLPLLARGKVERRLLEPVVARRRARPPSSTLAARARARGDVQRRVAALVGRVARGGAHVEHGLARPASRSARRAQHRAASSRRPSPRPWRGGGGASAAGARRSRGRGDGGGRRRRPRARAAVSGRPARRRPGGTPASAAWPAHERQSAELVTRSGGGAAEAARAASAPSDAAGARGGGATVAEQLVRGSRARRPRPRAATRRAAPPAQTRRARARSSATLSARGARAAAARAALVARCAAAHTWRHSSCVIAPPPAAPARPRAQAGRRRDGARPSPRWSVPHRKRFVSRPARIVASRRLAVARAVEQVERRVAPAAELVVVVGARHARGRRLRGRGRPRASARASRA